MISHDQNSLQGTIVNPTTNDKTRDGFCSSCDKPLNLETSECAGCSD